MSGKHMKIQSSERSLAMRVRVFCKVARPYLATFILGCLLLDFLVYILADLSYAPVSFLDEYENSRTFYPNPDRYIQNNFKICFWLLFTMFLLLSLLKLAHSKKTVKLDDGYIFLSILILVAMIMMNIHAYCPSYTNMLPSYFGNNLAQLEQVFNESTKTNEASDSTFSI